MSDTYNDGEMLSDSFEVFIEGQTYTANSFTPPSPALEITANDIHGAVARQRFVSNVQTGTIELQINAEAQNQPLKFKEFIVPAGFGFDAEYEIWVLIEETQNIVSGSTRTRSFNCRRVLNPVDVMVVEGAGTLEANGSYVRNGVTQWGSPIYSSTNRHFWGATPFSEITGTRWALGEIEPDTYGSQDVDYISSGDFLTPEEISGWLGKDFFFGFSPAFGAPGTAFTFTSTADKPDPTVRRGTRNDL